MRARITSSKHKNLSKKKKKKSPIQATAETTAKATFQSAASLLNEFIANSKPQALKKK